MIDDRQIIRVIEASAVARACDRLRRRIEAAARDSRLLPLLRERAGVARVRPGAVLIAAAITHVILQSMARPPLWYWLILPSIAFAAGLVLMLTIDSRVRNRG